MGPHKLTAATPSDTERDPQSSEHLGRLTKKNKDFSGAPQVALIGGEP
jgi:hypothetical protein